MTIALVHYHLRRGGVTRVLEAQSKALQTAGIEHVILSGTRNHGGAELPVVKVRDLDYRKADCPGLADTLREAATRALGSPPDLWHIHNPTLGKNAAFPRLLADLAGDGQRLLLQFHDFAEDGRPANYRHLSKHERLYPLGPQVHYAFINSRDRGLLVDAGLPADRCHLLPNAVTAPSRDLPPSPLEDERLVLYPVRGIRRKNLGELCLLAALAPERTRFALTLAPENRYWLKTYNRWVSFAEEFGLPVLLGVADQVAPVDGADPGFESWLRHATHLMTCSVAEGFGLAFLEPIALDRPLLGRDLPEITADFTRHGLELGQLYEDLLVPLDWIDQDVLRGLLETTLRATYGSYRRPVDDEVLDRAWDALLLGDYADFGNLPEEIQRPLITTALRHPDEVMVGINGECQPLQDWLTASLEETGSGADPEQLESYGLPSYGERLRGIYRQLHEAGSEAVDWLDPTAVLDRFLEPERFHFLRS